MRVDGSSSDKMFVGEKRRQKASHSRREGQSETEGEDADICALSRRTDIWLRKAKVVSFLKEPTRPVGLYVGGAVRDKLDKYWCFIYWLMWGVLYDS